MIAARNSLVIFLSIFIGVGNYPIVVCGDIIRVDTDGVVNVRDCIVILANRDIDKSSVAVRRGVLRVNADCAVVVRNRLVIFALIAVGNSTVVIGAGEMRLNVSNNVWVVRVYVDDILKVGNRPIKITLI